MRTSDAVRIARISNGVTMFMVAAGAVAAYALLRHHDPTHLPATRFGLDSPKLMLGFFAVAGLGALIAIPFVRRAMMPPLGPPSEVGATDAEIDRDAQPTVNKLQRAIARTSTMCLSIAITGGMAAYMLGDYRYYLPFGAISFIALLVYAPTAALFSRALAGRAR